MFGRNQGNYCQLVCSVGTIQFDLLKLCKLLIQLQQESFCCAVSMHDGVILSTTANLTDSLGFPKDVWLGRAFIDFVHPKDR